MIKPNIIGMMRIKNEEDWIIQTLDKASPIVSGFVILDDGSTDKTPELCKSNSKVIDYVYQDEKITDEVRDKNKLLKMTLEHEPEWILALDGDEVFEDIAPEVIFHEMSKCSYKITKIGFKFIYMWDSHDKFRCDNIYKKLGHYRLFKVVNPSELTFTPSGYGSNFHCGSIPPNLQGKNLSIDVYIKHYGYFYAKQREKKFNFYTAKDPENAKKGFYNHLVDQEGMIFSPWKERSINEVSLSK